MNISLQCHNESFYPSFLLYLQITNTKPSNLQTKVSVGYYGYCFNTSQNIAAKYSSMINNKLAYYKHLSNNKHL